MSKLRIGWFTFTCCEDSTIIFTELLNTFWDQGSKKIEFVSARVLGAKGEIANLDISFVEGAISSKDQAEKLKKIRENSRIVIAIGSCAVTGMPSGWRNTFDEKTKAEIAPLVARFSHLSTVEPIGKFIKVDDTVPGCPMSEEGFLQVLNKYL